MEVQKGVPVCPDVNCRVHDSVLFDKQSRISDRRAHGGALCLHAINLPLWVDRIRCMDPQRMEGKIVRYNLGHYSGCVCDFVCGQERNLGKPEGIPGNAAPDSARAKMHYNEVLNITPSWPEHTMASARSTVLAAGSTRRSWPMRRPFGGMKTTSRHTIIWRQFTRIVAGLTRQRNSGCVRWKSILNTGSRMKI